MNDSSKEIVVKALEKIGLNLVANRNTSMWDTTIDMFIDNNGSIWFGRYGNENPDKSDTYIKRLSKITYFSSAIDTSINTSFSSAIDTNPNLTLKTIRNPYFNITDEYELQIQIDLMSHNIDIATSK